MGMRGPTLGTRLEDAAAETTMPPANGRNAIPAFSTE